MVKKIKMSLVGVNGNAFAIMGAFQANAKRQGWTDDEIGAVLKKAKSGDYNNLIAVICDNITN